MSAVEPPIRPQPPASQRVGPGVTASPARLSLLQWLGLATVRPVRAVRGSDHFGWLGSWAIHLLGLLMGVVAVLLAAWMAGLETAGRRMPVGVMTELGLAVDDLFTAATRDGASLVLALAAVAAGLLMIHVGMAFSALTLMSWAGRGDERVRTSWARALQRLWRLTPFMVVMVAAITLATHLAVVAGHLGLGWQYWDLEAYLWSGAWLAMVAWPLGVTLAALHPGPARPHCRWPATCEGCGYALMGLDAQQTCPECGTPVERSTAADSRPGLAWGSWREGTFLTGWGATVTQAIFVPTRVGRSLHLLAPDDRHRSRFALHLLAALLTAAPGTLATLAVVRWIFGEPIGLDFIPATVFMTLLIGTWTMAMMASVQLGGAGLLGGLASWLCGRNLLPAANQAMACLGGYMLFWIATVWGYCLAAMIATYLVFEYFRYQFGAWGAWDPLGLIWLGFLGLNTILAAGYLILLWRIVRAAKHANW